MDVGLGKTPGAGDGQGGLACCASWGHIEADTTERPNLTEYYIYVYELNSSRNEYW